jgi:hypothetical protein
MEKDLKIGNNIVVHCPTEELAKEVLAIADQLGYKWFNGDPLTKNSYWADCEEDTCYNLTEGLFAPLDYYMLQKMIIISAEEFISLHKN